MFSVPLMVETEPTCIRSDNNSSLIDLVLMSAPENLTVCETVPPLANSDHLGSLDHVHCCLLLILQSYEFLRTWHNHHIIRLLPCFPYYLSCILTNKYSTCVTNFSCCFPTDRGKKSPEYITLRENLSKVVGAFSTVSGSKDELCLKYMENNWLPITASPSKRDLVILALANTEADARKFHEFVRMLSEINGMQSTAKNLITCLQECKI